MADLERDELTWLDGDMPYSQRFGDHFYSRADGRAECGHVFMGGNGLPERWTEGGDFTIGELGFGTGLNFLETWRRWRECRKPGAILDFVSFEAFPMEGEAIGRALAHWPELEDLAAILSAALARPDDCAATLGDGRADGADRHRRRRA
jgi:tRNA U34 5-methylaminomethyl-2-thiouridine-forming methyltransferase MnmC